MENTKTEQVKPVLKADQNYFMILKTRVHAALETYANVHRGSGCKSAITTRLYEQARDIVLKHMRLDAKKFMVVFASVYGAGKIKQHARQAFHTSLDSNTTGLRVGVTAIALRKNALPSGAPSIAGGGTARLTSEQWILWEKEPAVYEPGTPAILNCLAFVLALQMQERYGKNIFTTTDISQNTDDSFLEALDYAGLKGEDLLDKLRDEMPGNYFTVSVNKESLSYVNLDNSASTPAFNPVWEAWCNGLMSNAHKSTTIKLKVKEICASFFNAPESNFDVIFTQNTTEAINIAARNVSQSFEENGKGIVLSSLLEHSSNDLPWRIQPNILVKRLTPDDEGFLSLGEMEQMLKAHNHTAGSIRIQWVAITGASNVYGTCNNIPEIAALAHKYGARILVDAAQLVAHRPIDMLQWDVDCLVFSGHKIYAPFGSGAMLVKKNIWNHMSTGLPASENIAGIAALGKSLQLLGRIGMDIIVEKEQQLTRYGMEQMTGIEGVILLGINTPKNVNFSQKLGVIIFTVQGKMADVVAKELAAYGIGIRAGCHCAHIIVKRILNISPFLEKFQRLMLTIFPHLHLPGVGRVSLGVENSYEDIHRLVAALKIITGGSKKQQALLRQEHKANQDRLVQKSLESVFFTNVNH